MEANLKMKGDIVPELLIYGSVLSGDRFDTDLGGLACTLQLIAGDDWEVLSDTGVVQSHISHPNRSTNQYVWSQQFETLYVPTSIEGWPTGIIQVMAANKRGKLTSLSYGKFPIPFEPGYHIIDCCTWSPVGDCRSSDLIYYFGCYPKLKNISLIGTNDEKLSKLNCSSNGTIHIEVNIVKNNF